MARAGRSILAILAIPAVLVLVSACSARAASNVVEIDIRYSAFEPAVLSVPAGVPITFVIVNGDPIDHEWIVGDAASQQRHRTGTEPAHEERPTEISIAAGATRSTVITFDEPGTFAFICHLPGHEAYGMVGTLEVTHGS